MGNPSNVTEDSASLATCHLPVTTCQYLIAPGVETTNEDLRWAPPPPPSPATVITEMKNPQTAKSNCIMSPFWQLPHPCSTDAEDALWQTNPFLLPRSSDTCEFIPTNRRYSPCTWSVWIEPSAASSAVLITLTSILRMTFLSYAQCFQDEFLNRRCARPWVLLTSWQ